MRRAHPTRLEPTGANRARHGACMDTGMSARTTMGQSGGRAEGAVQ